MDTFRQLRLALLVVVALILFGTLGFSYIEHMSVLDAVYTSVITITTLGIELVKPLSPAGRIFTAALSLMSVFIIFTVVSAAILNAVEMATSEKMQHLIWRRKMEKSIRGIKDHQIICGFGRMGQAIAKELRASNVPFVVIESNPTQMPKLIESRIFFVEGDASDEKTLVAAGAARAKGLIAVAPTDADNTFIVLTAKEINPQLFVVARSIKVEDEPKLRRAGADRVMSPYILGGKRMAWAVLHPSVFDFVESAVGSENLEFEINEITVPNQASFANKTIVESRIREDSGANIIAIRGRDDGLIVNPAPDFKIKTGDVLVAVGTPKQINALKDMANVPV